jgi:two-component system, OmpR family, response regulator CpxR
MSVVTFFCGSYCNGKEIAERTAQKLRYALIDKEIIEAASRQFQISNDKLERALFGTTSLLNSVTQEREKCVAYIQAACAEYLKKDDFIYNGYATHLIPKTLNHVLRICIIADRDYRIKQAIASGGLNEKQAMQQIEQDDELQCQWTKHLFDTGPWDRKLYDIKIPMHSMDIDDAVTLICENVSKETLQTTAASRDSVDDFILSSKVNIALIEKGYIVDTACDAGKIIITINKFTWRLERMKAKLTQIAQTVPGVTDVITRIGPHFDRPRISPLDFDVPSQVLLVDDEKEFVLTLSERLKMRKIPSQVVYDGEAALSFVKDEEPDVIVLDLKMPGIQGMDVLRKVKRDHPNIEVIILTGHGSEKDEELTRDLGAFAYLQKPVDIDKLAETMKAAYEKIQKQATPQPDIEA